MRRSRCDGLPAPDRFGGVAESADTGRLSWSILATGSPCALSPERAAGPPTPRVHRDLDPQPLRTADTGDHNSGQTGQRRTHAPWPLETQRLRTLLRIPEPLWRGGLRAQRWLHPQAGGAAPCRESPSHVSRRVVPRDSRAPRDDPPSGSRGCPRSGGLHKP